MTYEEAKAKIKKILMAEIDRLPSHYDYDIDEQVFSSTAEVNELLELNKIVCEALERQTHNCKDCRHADYTKRENAIYCLEHSCIMSSDNCCRDWSDSE